MDSFIHTPRVYSGIHLVWIDWTEKNIGLPGGKNEKNV